jgi:hypothetical protein
MSTQEKLATRMALTRIEMMERRDRHWALNLK